MNKRIYKKWIWLALLIALVFVGIQFINPAIENPPVTSEIMLPAAVKKILQANCYDCHSNETKLSWFDKITPANWLVAEHIRKGRAAMNFSTWGNLPTDRQHALLFESLNLAQYKIMPLNAYRLVHGSANFNAAAVDTLKSYLAMLTISQVYDSSKIRRADQQYANWINGIGKNTEVKPSPNGIPYMPVYKDWVAISTTDRTDNGTMRVIAGNNITINAIKEKHTNPWPDGSAFAKILWAQSMDSSGEINSGEFIQVDFMIKDKNKYGSTKGWGYARWLKGTQLIPYGTNVMFSTECANCHRSMKNVDYIFTEPVQIPVNPGHEDKVINSSINKKSGTMATLYGNEIAVRFARKHTGSDYPAGSILTLVTWQQKEDAHWFGGQIPGDIHSIEKVKFNNTGNLRSSPYYEKYAGMPLKKIQDSNLYDEKERLAYIVGKRASVMP
ncbi:MAG: cytochrome P460 family protein [Chitinophagaceae bacterium]